MDINIQEVFPEDEPEQTHQAANELSDIRVETVGLVERGANLMEKWILLKNRSQEEGEKKMTKHDKVYSVRLSKKQVEIAQKSAERVGAIYAGKPAIGSGIKALIEKMDTQQSVDSAVGVLVALDVLTQKSEGHLHQMALDCVCEYLSTPALLEALDVYKSERLDPDDPIAKMAQDKNISYREALLQLSPADQLAVLNNETPTLKRYGDPPPPQPNQARDSDQARYDRAYREWLKVLGGPAYSHLSDEERKRLAAENAEAAPEISTTRA